MLAKPKALIIDKITSTLYGVAVCKLNTKLTVGLDHGIIQLL